MEIDLACAPEDAEALARQLRSQVCIVGGGIAGLTLAAELDSQGIHVTLLEAGGRTHPLAADADPFGAELRGTPHAGTAMGRVRALGGTSHIWGGQLLPLPQDAEWPLPPSSSAHPPGDRDAVDARAFLAAHGQPPPALLNHLPGIVARFSRFLPFAQRNLDQRLGQNLRRSSRVKVVLHAAAREILLAPAADCVDALVVRGQDGSELRLEADQFVLAAGTVETCRLLLASRGVQPAGVGNKFGQVGRRFHDHLTCSAAELTGSARVLALRQLRPWIFGRPLRKQELYSLKLEAGSDLRTQLGIPPAMAHLTIEEPEGTGVAVLRQLLRARQTGGLAAVLQRAALRGALRQLPGALLQALRLAWEARVRQRRYVSPHAKMWLQINLAQQPSEAMRITLGDAVTREGLPPAVVHWAVSDADVGHLRAFAGYLRERLEAAGWAEGIRWFPGLCETGPGADAALRARVDDARHAMGGACLGTDPRTSVVDPELRVHGIGNLSVASAAVFPDGSAQLPTATLMDLCRRLAERLRRELA